jgi:TonB family protein
MPQRHRDTETLRRRDRGREGQRDGGMERKWRLSVSLSLLLSIPLWPCVSVASSIQIGSFEKQAISSTQKMSASDLDSTLPDRPFASWFNEVVGLNAGVVWQLTECGEQISAPDETDKTGQDLPACVEASAMLPNWRKVFVLISVGTFKKGLTGKPTFSSGVIEQDERFYQIRRLSDLPEKLRALKDTPETYAENPIADPPAIKMDSKWFSAPFRFMVPSSIILPRSGDQSREEELPAPAPPPAPQALEQIPESLSQSRAITKVKPAYPPNAKRMSATGTVEVEIIVSEAGLVVDATAISGHLALRSAAVEAARKWVFEPAILDGKPVRVKSVLTFVFAPSAKQTR